MRFRDFKQRLLVELYHQQRQIGFRQYMEPKDVADAAGLLSEPGQIRLCINEFDGMGLVKGAFTLGGGIDRGLSCYLTGAGVELAEEWDEEICNPGSLKSEAVPASDRIVTLDHNAGDYRDAVASLDKVIAEVREERSNDFFDKDQRLAELNAGKVLLEAEQASVRTVLSVLTATLRYLALKFVDVPVGQAAKVAWNALLRLLGF